MQSVIIENSVNFFQKLFFSQIFDDFLFLEGNIVTNCTYSLNGRLNKSYFSEEDYNSIPEPKLISFKEIKHVWKTLLGEKYPDVLPVKLSLVICLSKEQTERLLANGGCSITPDNIESLHINIKYENNILTCITGTSLKIFTLDKSLEEYFDKYTSAFLGRF